MANIDGAQECNNEDEEGRSDIESVKEDQAAIPQLKSFKEAIASLEQVQVTSAKVYKGSLPQWCESVLALQAAAFTGFSWSQLTSQQHLPSTFSLIRVQSQRSFSFSIYLPPSLPSSIPIIPFLFSSLPISDVAFVQGLKKKTLLGMPLNECRGKCIV